MTQVNLISQTGEKKGTLNIKDEIFKESIRPDIVHSSCVNYLNNKRRGTSSTKTKAEVRGGGRKPWKQKGTGRARVGSIRSPLWKGGGITFGPKPRDYKKTLTKQIRHLAIKSALSARFSENKIIFVDSIKIDAPKTKDFMKMLANLNAENKVLIIIREKDANISKSSDNLKNVKVITANRINTYDIINADTVILTKDTVNFIEEALS